jgi:phosphatidylglycerol:prolipoprotein diacylglycerol transferase
MTLYPLSFHIGPIEITGFGIMVMMGFFMAGLAIQTRLQELELNDQYAWDMVMAAVIGGLLGAKLWYVALHGDATQLLSRGGLVWYGGLIGGALAVILNSMRLKVPVRFTFDLAAPALAMGYALGRVGCFLVQDDYGIPTTLPWGVKFPEGLPPTTAANLSAWGVPVPEGAAPLDVLAVHPTQLYETAAMLLVFWILWRLRNHNRGTGWLFGLYLMLAGTERFLIEFLRAKDDRFIAGFTLAQLTSLAVVGTGALLVSAFGQKAGLAVRDLGTLKPQPPEASASPKQSKKGRKRGN